VLGSLADSTHPFAKVLSDASRPMLILGPGALARADGAAILKLAATIAGETGMIGPSTPQAEGGWNGFNVLHAAASRVGALDLDFLPRNGGRDTAAILDGAANGEIDFVYLLGADELDVGGLGRAFVVYQGTHGDAGAHRADVVLPGAAYTEKEGLYVNFEGRIQRGRRAAFPLGEAKEDWAILRALSDVLGKRLPYDDRDTLRAAITAEAPHFAEIGALPARPAADPGIWDAIGVAGQPNASLPLASPIVDFYLTNPIARASETMAECSRIFVSGAQRMAAE
jgi:NADH-quinone oxidoreductase subunit G